MQQVWLEIWWGMSPGLCMASLCPLAAGGSMLSAELVPMLRCVGQSRVGHIDPLCSALLAPS